MLKLNRAVKQIKRHLHRSFAFALIIIALLMQVQPVAAGPGGGFPCGDGCPQSAPTPTEQS